MASIAEIQEILRQAAGLPDGPVKIALHEDAVRRADLLGDTDWRFHTRHALVRVCFTGGDPERMLVALSWCLAKCDELGGCFNEKNLLWGCKYALSYISAFPQISRAQIESLQVDVTNRFRKFGASLRIPYLYGMCNQLSMGYPQKAAEYRQLWQDAPADEFTEPPAWEVYDDAWYHLEAGNADRALELAMPMLDGRQPASNAYHWIVDLVLLDLLKRGAQQLALDAHQRAYRLCADNPKFIGHVGTHLVFLALTGNFARVASLLSKHLDAALEIRVPSSRFSFMLSAWAAARQLHLKGCKPTPLRLPKAFPLWRADGVVSWESLAAWFATQALDLEAQFNARNGTERYAKFRLELAALDTFANDWPIA